MDTLDTDSVLRSQGRYHIGREASVNLDCFGICLNASSTSAVRSRYGEDGWRGHCGTVDVVIGNLECLEAG